MSKEISNFAIKALIVFTFLTVSILILNSFGVFNQGTKGSDENASSHNQTTTYWLNSNSNTLHNSDCKWFGNTSEGHFTKEAKGKNCGICGGSNTKKSNRYQTPADNQSGKYWLNSNSNTLHNSNCKWYGKTKKGRFTDKAIGKNCGICGGAAN